MVCSLTGIWIDIKPGLDASTTTSVLSLMAFSLPVLSLLSPVQIQGTGAVVLSGFINAARLASEASGLPLTEHKILFFGSGSAGVGVAKQLLSFFTLLGLSEEEAKSRIYVREPFSSCCALVVHTLTASSQTVDSKGLITVHRKGLQEHKKCKVCKTTKDDDLSDLVPLRLCPYRLRWARFDEIDRHHRICQTYSTIGPQHHPSRSIIVSH